MSISLIHLNRGINKIIKSFSRVSFLMDFPNEMDWNNTFSFLYKAQKNETKEKAFSDKDIIRKENGYSWREGEEGRHTKVSLLKIIWT